MRLLLIFAGVCELLAGEFRAGVARTPGASAGVMARTLVLEETVSHERLVLVTVEGCSIPPDLPVPARPVIVTSSTPDEKPCPVIEWKWLTGKSIEEASEVMEAVEVQNIVMRGRLGTTMTAFERLTDLIEGTPAILLIERDGVPVVRVVSSPLGKSHPQINSLMEEYWQKAGGFPRGATLILLPVGPSYTKCCLRVALDRDLMDLAQSWSNPLRLAIRWERAEKLEWIDGERAMVARVGSQQIAGIPYAFTDDDAQRFRLSARSTSAMFVQTGVAVGVSLERFALTETALRHAAAVAAPGKRKAATPSPMNPGVSADAYWDFESWSSNSRDAQGKVPRWKFDLVGEGNVRIIGRSGSGLRLAPKTGTFVVSPSSPRTASNSAVSLSLWIHPIPRSGQGSGCADSMLLRGFGAEVRMTKECMVTLQGGLSGTVLDPQKWNHLAITLSNSGMWQLFANGQLTASAARMERQSAAPVDTRWTIGGGAAMGIDDVAVFGRTLTTADARRLNIGPRLKSPSSSEGTWPSSGGEPLGSFSSWSPDTSYQSFLADQQGRRPN